MQRAAIIFQILTRGIVLLLVAASLLTAATLGYARYLGLSILSVQTGSMRPGIQPGDAVLVHQAPALGGLAVGDIVSYRSLDNPKLVITHRIVSINHLKGQFVTQGDALDKPDRAFGSDRLVGKVEHVVPFAGYSFDFVRRPYGLVALVYVPALILTGGEIRRLMRYYARQHYRLPSYS